MNLYPRMLLLGLLIDSLLLLLRRRSISTLVQACLRLPLGSFSMVCRVFRLSSRPLMSSTVPLMQLLITLRRFRLRRRLRPLLFRVHPCRPHPHPPRPVLLLPLPLPHPSWLTVVHQPLCHSL